MLYEVITIFPYLLYYTVSTLIDEEGEERVATFKRVRRAIGGGLMKIMSKMGISTISSYRNSKLFDAIGLSSYNFV